MQHETRNRNNFDKCEPHKCESTLTLFYSNQTILQFCENWIDDQSTLTLFFPATADATSSNKTSLER